MATASLTLELLAAGNQIKMTYALGTAPTGDYEIGGRESWPIFEIDIDTQVNGGWRAGPHQSSSTQYEKEPVHTIETTAIGTPTPNGNDLEVTVTLEHKIPSDMTVRLRHVAEGLVITGNDLVMGSATQVAVTNNSTYEFDTDEYTHVYSAPYDPDDDDYHEGGAYLEGSTIQLAWDSERASLPNGPTINSVVEDAFDPDTNTISILVNRDGPNERTVTATEFIEGASSGDHIVWAQFRLSGTIYAHENIEVTASGDIVKFDFTGDPGTFHTPADYNAVREVRYTPDHRDRLGGYVWNVSEAYSVGQATPLDTKLFKKTETIIERYGKTVQIYERHDDENWGPRGYSPALGRVVPDELRGPGYEVKVSPPEEYSNMLIDGEIVRRGDARVIMAKRNLPFTEPKLSWTMEFDGVRWTIINVETIYSGEDIVAYWCHIRR